MYTYCLFCRTDKTRYIACEARDLTGCRTLVPKRVQHTWSQGKMVNRIRDLFPGYLFLYSEELLEMSRVRQIPGVIRCLRSSDENYHLAGADDAFAGYILEARGIIGKTRVLEKDHRLELGPEAFGGAKVSILKVDRRAQRMQIEIRFARQMIRTWIEYEIVHEEDME